jgi:hypothetical protein
MTLRDVAAAPVRPVLRVLQRRVDNAVRVAEDRMERRLAEEAGRLRAEKDAESAEQHRMRELRLAEITHELDDQVRRISSQLVALEHRVAELERSPVELAAEPADRREARGLLDEVRTEHNRVRAELATIAFYEERIARLERDRV